MNKKELLKHNPPYKMLLDIYNNDDEIPVDFIKMLYKPRSISQNIFIGNEKTIESFQKALKYENKRTD
ncbi:hypothetical protein M0Q50_06635 [bacterium]|jgi:hypothetical protein|nr:hypothetical protein [bacterium]